LPDPATPLDHALAYAALSWRVHPCNPNNDHVPLLSGWSQLATTDPAQLRWWWRRYPNATPAVALDPPMLVLDVDFRQSWTHAPGDPDTQPITIDGRKSFKRLVGHLPSHLRTPIATTPHDGLHLFCQHHEPLRTSIGQLGKGLDLRAPISSVPLPSGHNTRQWLKAPWEVPLAPLPNAILAKAQRETASRDNDPPPAPEAPFRGSIRAGVLELVHWALSEIQSQMPGTQEKTLNAKCYALGGLVAAGELPFAELRDALVQAAMRMTNGDPARPWVEADVALKVDRTLRDGMRRPWLPTEALTEQAFQTPPPASEDILLHGGAPP
jgi:hypothetical protein